jgi:hypothetical protein
MPEKGKLDRAPTLGDDQPSRIDKGSQRSLAERARTHDHLLRQLPESCNMYDSRILITPIGLHSTRT